MIRARVPLVKTLACLARMVILVTERPSESTRNRTTWHGAPNRPRELAPGICRWPSWRGRRVLMLPYGVLGFAEPSAGNLVKAEASPRNS
jgi:hypothetical protein